MPEKHVIRASPALLVEGILVAAPDRGEDVMQASFGKSHNCLFLSNCTANLPAGDANLNGSSCEC
jgi:hypothetical protein